MATVLKIENLHKSFKLGFIPRKREILKGISFSVEAGEIFGYLGPNGAGKTTTLKCALGLIFPDQGDIEIFGHPHFSLKAKERLGYLPENPYFYEYLASSPGACSRESAWPRLSSTTLRSFFSMSRWAASTLSAGKSSGTSSSA
jgi:ABC-2 type transport system ATP-binding protein